MMFVVESLIPREALARIDELLKRSVFVDGRVSAGPASDKKRNLELQIGDSYAEIAALLNAAVDSSARISQRLLPRFRTNPIINRYDVGMFYGAHIDAPIQGGLTQVGRSPGRFGQNFLRTDYSMTVFLTPPDSYDGGELELRVLDETRPIKLACGAAVCYSTGLPHSITPVTRGCRIAAIYWFQSLIRDVHVRRSLWDQYELEQALLERGQAELAQRAADVRSNLLRYLAEL